MQLEVLDDRCGETHINGAKLSAGEVRDLYNADILTVTDRKFKIFYPLPSAKRQVKLFSRILKYHHCSSFV